jgi:hypothetical protein
MVPETLARLPLPDKFITFGQYYKDLLIKQSWRRDKILVIGNPSTATYSLLNRHHNHGELSEVSKQFKYVMIIVSQFTVIDTFIEFLRNAGDHDDCLFIIKTHPRGSGEREEYESNLKIGQNIIFSPPGMHLWDLFQHASAAMGVYSTGILDALSFGIPAFCLQSTLPVYFADLIEGGYMDYVKTIDEVKLKLARAHTVKAMSLYQPMSFEMINII